MSNGEPFENQRQNNYHKLWEIEERRALRALREHLTSENFGELHLVNEVIQSIPSGCNLHLANSMSVRYANFIGLKPLHQNVKVFANRGTSGIDGCTSTAIGHALAGNSLNVLITGDQAFFYDRNAFWHNYSIPNLRVVLLNNHGGIIFKMIDGPGETPEAAEYFVTDQRLNAKNLCNEFGIEHLKLDNKRKLKNLMRDIFEPDGKASVLEFESDLTLNRTLFENLRQQIRKSYEL
jgi:2-succinyl-5-enolpyruvyl-6-hydroxy-3-cyclohexene-1-carboxylate synthase